MPGPPSAGRLGHAPAKARVRLRPTAHSGFFALVLAAMLIAAINYQSNAAWLIGLAVVGMVAVSALHTWRNLRGVSARLGQCPPVVAGEVAQVPVSLGRDGDGGRATWAVDVSLPGAAAPARIERIGHDAAATAVIPVATTRSGRLRIASLRLVSAFPLGLIRARVDLPVGDGRVDGDVVGIVYVRPEGVPLADAPGTPGAPGADRMGGGVSGEPGGDDFAGHRSWQPGESQRRVDWKAVARRGDGPSERMALPAKIYAGSAGAAFEFAFDALSGSDEARVAQLARWVREAARDGLRYSLRLDGVVIPADSGEAHHHACQRALALHGGMPAESGR